jgi:hypothetical protein
VFIASRAGVPVVPCGLDTFGWSARNRRPSVAVFGDPIRLDRLPSGREGTREGLEIVGDEVLRLWALAREARALGLPAALPTGERRSGAVGAAPARTG